MMFLTEREFWVSSGSRTWTKITDIPTHTVESLIDDGYSKGPFISFGSCCWYIVVTMTTTGYGDIFPYDWQGRLYGSIAVLSGLVVVSLMIGVISNKLVPNEFQIMVIDWMNKRELTKEVHRYAAILIQTAWKEHRKLLHDEKRVKRNKVTTIKVSIRPWVKQLRAAKKKLGALETYYAEKEDDQAEIVQKILDNLKLRTQGLIDRIPKSQKQNEKKKYTSSSLLRPDTSPSSISTTFLHLAPKLRQENGIKGSS